MVDNSSYRRDFELKRGPREARDRASVVVVWLSLRAWDEGRREYVESGKGVAQRSRSCAVRTWCSLFGGSFTPGCSRQIGAFLHLRAARAPHLFWRSCFYLHSGPLFRPSFLERHRPQATQFFIGTVLSCLFCFFDVSTAPIISTAYPASLPPGPRTSRVEAR